MGAGGSKEQGLCSHTLVFSTLCAGLSPGLGSVGSKLRGRGLGTLGVRMDEQPFQPPSAQCPGPVLHCCLTHHGCPSLTQLPREPPCSLKAHETLGATQLGLRA